LALAGTIELSLKHIACKLNDRLPQLLDGKPWLSLCFMLDHWVEEVVWIVWLNV
jgi:hypothetical protein